MRRLALTVTLTALLAGCNSSGRAVCAKMRECCIPLNYCQEINREGAGFEERCEISSNAAQDEMATFKRKECAAIASAAADLEACMGAVACSDIGTGTILEGGGHVIRCDAKAVVLCNAQKAAADACGGYLVNPATNCDQASANILVYGMLIGR